MPKPGRLMRHMAVCLLLLLCAVAHASVTVLLEEPYGKLGHVSPSGHSAVYLDHVCAATPIRLRACAPGEFGSVISRYDKIGSRDWIAVPLLGYLYSVDEAQDIPLTVRRSDAFLLRDAYRRKHLELVVPDNEDGTAPAGNWYELAGAAFDRTIYGFQVDSTPEQDAAFIAFMNDHQNRSVYNGAMRNCADFVRTTVNRFYPHAIHRNYIADLGMTSPKSVARGISRYAARHPETQMVEFRIAQLSGDLPRSHPAVTLAEGVLKEFGIPLTIVSPVATGVTALAYVVGGRFDEPKNAPVVNFRTDIDLAGAVNVNESNIGSGFGELMQASFTEGATDESVDEGEQP